jgi:hypothetical protein
LGALQMESEGLTSVLKPLILHALERMRRDGRVAAAPRLHR